MKGNEAAAEAAIRAGCRYYYGYPITPQSELLEYMGRRLPEVGGVFLQSESEIAGINMVYGSAAAGKRVMTSSSSTGIALMQEGVSYLCASELPCVVVNVSRAGPGLGRIQPSQADYNQVTRGGGAGDYKNIVLAPSSVQEMADFTFLAFELADRYRNPVFILADGMLGQMMETIELDHLTPIEAPKKEWALTGAKGRARNVILPAPFDDPAMLELNKKLAAKYRGISQKEVRFEVTGAPGADLLIVSFGTSARICLDAIEAAMAEGLSICMIRPITLWPFPSAPIAEAATKAAVCMVVEMNAGQMVQDVLIAVAGRCPVIHYGRGGGAILSPEEVLLKIRELALQEVKKG